VDAHRSLGYVVGPFVKQGAVVSKHYTTVSMIKTMEEILGLKPMNLYDALAEPMTDVFDLEQADWDYEAIIPEVLRKTQLPLPAATTSAGGPRVGSRYTGRLRDAAYWENAMKGLDFSVEDNLDEPRFNRVLWAGLRGESTPFPTERHGRDLRQNRKKLLQAYRQQLQQELATDTAASSASQPEARR
jgi:hypothetical protein